MFYIGREKYRLELKWSEVVYEKEGVAELKGAYFAGPAVQICYKLNEKDEITIDMTNQYIIFVPYFYIAKLKWEGVEYGADKIILKKAKIESKYINSIPKLKDTDFFVIDTFRHEEKTHQFYINYDCTLLDENKNPYRF